jgi:hypothetical protein
VCADVRVRSFIAPTLSDPPTHRACAWIVGGVVDPCSEGGGGLSGGQNVCYGCINSRHAVASG